MGKLGKKKTIAISCIFAIMVFLLIIFLKHTDNQEKELSNNNSGLTAEAKFKVEELFLEPEAIAKLGTTRWSVNSSEKTIKIFVWNLTPENRKYDGMKIDGWKVKIIEDRELKREIKDVNGELSKRLGNWASWTISYDPRSGSKEVTVWVHELSDEAKNLNNTTICGWRIRVYKSILPPKEVVLSDPRIKAMLKGKEYEITEVKSRQSGRKLLADVYIHVREPEKTIIATVDVVEGKVININEKG